MQGTNSIITRKGFLPFLLILGGATLLALAFIVDALGLSEPGFSSNQLALAVSGLAAILTGGALVATVNQRHIVEWLLVGAGAVAAAFAADLLVVGGLPGMGSKQLVLISATLGVLLIGVLPASGAGWPRLRDWREIVAANKVQAAQFLGLLLQLGLLAIVIRQYALENQAFYHNIMLLTLYGFIIHYFLPSRYRQPFFILLSLAAIFGVLGLGNGFWLVGIGLGLIGICHLPIPFSGRIGLLLLAGAGLALLRVDWISAPWLAAVWPILGSMFMFRLIVYLYDLKHSKKPAGIAETLSYFFLLPNVVFPLFPVVDFATFRRTYFNEEQHRIFQRGVQWILWGVIQLILYRYVNYYLVIAVEDVTNALELARYIIANYLIFIRVSGQFFVIVGLLHLFGFNLPRTHDRYLLASSFTDLWRRNNIYWKDFMQKVFYMPAYFRLNRLGTVSRLVAATALIIILTWFLHAYQWFWLRGRFLLSGPDVLFWTLLGVLVIANTVREARRGRKRVLGERTLGFKDLASSSFRIAGTFSGIAILWSLWSSESIADALALWATAATPQGVLTLALVFLGIMLVLGIVLWIDSRLFKQQKGKAEPTRTFFKSAAFNGTLIAALFLLGNPAVHSRIGGQAGALLADLSTSRLSDRDAKLLQKGYYEDLIGVSQFNSDLWDIYTKRPSDWPLIHETEAGRKTDSFQIFELVPSSRISYRGEPFSVNRWGMRDQDYEQVPPPDTYRIALTGASFVMGSGVADNQVFEAVLEERLNNENDGVFFKQYQILNFAVAGYSALQELHGLETQALAFEPDALLFVGHQLEEEINVRNLANRLIIGSDMPYDYLDELAERAGVVEGMTQAEAERRLKPYSQEILTWTYERVAALARENGMQPIWVFMPTMETEPAPEIIAELFQLAEESGFVVLDLSSAYENQDLSSLIVAEWDKHPNVRGHQLLADHLYEALKANAEAIPFNFAD